MRRILLTLPLFLTVAAIRVPVVNVIEEQTSVPSSDNSDDTTEAAHTPQSSEGNIDSYLVPPNPYAYLELPGGVNAPPTFLVPPPPNLKSDYFVLIENKTTDASSDWLPMQRPNIQKQKQISASQYHQPKSVPLRLSAPRHHPYQIPILTKDAVTTEEVEGDTEDAVKIMFSLPSRQLEPPSEDSPTNFAANDPVEYKPYVERKHKSNIQAPSLEFQLPIETPYLNFNSQKLSIPATFDLPKAQPTLSLHLTPPKQYTSKYPTKLYPKKYNSQGFHPIPIPIAPYNDAVTLEVPKAKPEKPFTPVGNIEEYYPTDDKRIYQYEKYGQKRKLKEAADNAVEQEKQVEEPVGSINEPTENEGPPEQDTSETKFRNPSSNTYPARLRQEPSAAPPAVPLSADNVPPPGDRTEFRMHGMKGPHSYQFGYDTGKGKNRQFRFEERDNDGTVRGHYGYVDRAGKLRVVNYNADPEGGFHAESPQDKQ